MGCTLHGLVNEMNGEILGNKIFGNSKSPLFLKYRVPFTWKDLLLAASQFWELE